MSGVSEEYVEKMTELRSNALKAKDELMSLLRDLSQYHIRKYSGVELALGDFRVPGVRPIDEVVVETRKKIGVLAGKYSKIFPREFAKLNPEKLYNFKCLPATVLLSSVDFVGAVRETLVAMDKRILEINEKEKELYRMASEGRNKSSGLSALLSAANYRLLDSHTTETALLQDFEREIQQSDTQAERLIGEEAMSTVMGSTSKNETSKRLAAMGLTPVAADPVTGQVANFNLWLLKKQYPKSVRLCRKTKQELSLEKLSEARMLETAKKDAIASVSAQASSGKKGCGQEHLESMHFKAMDVVLVKKLDALAMKKDEPFAAPYRKKREVLRAAIGSCSTQDGVKQYVREYSKLIASLTPLIS